jgi:tripartite-type tricarboxylate transporter receptor subunit TctC
MRRIYSVTAIAALGAMLMLGSAAAQDDYPNKPIRIVVAFTAGSGNDVTARELARLLYPILGQPVVVENKTGAGGIIGTDAVAKAPADGYTLGLGTSSQLVMNVGLRNDLPFDVDKDLAMVALLTRTPLVAIASSQGPKSIKELIEISKAKPGSINYGSGGSGSISHIVAEAFAQQAGIKMTHIPYKGNAAALTDVLSNTIQLLFDGLVNGSALGDKVRMLALSEEKRNPAYPNVPTFAESGMPGYEAYTWNAIFAPAGLPPEMLKKLNSAINQALASPTFAELTARSGGVVLGPSTPADAEAFGIRERKKWVPFIKSMNLTN